jgi:hypothetical protein
LHGDELTVDDDPLSAEFLAVDGQISNGEAVVIPTMTVDLGEKKGRNRCRFMFPDEENRTDTYYPR